MSGERCRRCVLSSSVPGSDLDADGICAACRGAAGGSDLDRAIAAAKDQVHTLFAEHHKPYDAVLCNSGGKDSSYTLMMAVQKYGLRVLSFTLDNGFLPPAAFDNIRRITDRLGVDQITFRPSLPFFRRVMRAVSTQAIYREQSLVRISAGCNACISLVNMMALRIALEKKIPFILAGFTLGQIPSHSIIFRNHYRFLEESRREVLARLTAAVGEEVAEYYTIPDSVVNGVTSYPLNINLLCLETLREEDMVAEVEKLGWRKPEGVDGCSSNCELNTFNNYVHEKQFGYSPYELELSVLVRKGLLSREEAIAKLEDNPTERLTELVERLQLSQEECLALGLHEPLPRR